MAYKVNLHNITELGPVGRVVEAGELWRAWRYTPGLVRELPYPAEGYSNPIKAYRRLARIARTAAEHNLSAYTISLVGADVTTIGVATAQLAQPKPNLIEEQTEKLGGVELSYWHSLRSKGVSTEIGQMVVRTLREQKALIPGASGLEVSWMVTLPDDVIKEEVCLASGFTPVDKPQPYDIEDMVSEPRQLWVAKNL